MADFSSILEQIDVDEVEVTAIITCTVDGILEIEDLLVASNASSAETVVLAQAHKVASNCIAIAEDNDPARLGRVREKWHNIARLMCSGLSNSMVASLSGYTEAYLSVLTNNPAFREVLQLYSETSGAANTAKIITEQLRTLGLSAVEMLGEKLQNEDGVSVLEAIAIAKLGLDRSGHGPSSTVTATSETHIIDHAELKRLEAAARADSSQYIVPVSRIRQNLIENKPAA